MSRGGGNVTHVNMPSGAGRGENPLSAFMQTLPGLMQQHMQNKYMKAMLAQQEAAAAKAKADAEGLNAAGAQSADVLRTFAQYVDQVPPQTQQVQGAQVPQAQQPYTIPTYTQGMDGKMTPGAPVQGVDAPMRPQTPPVVQRAHGSSGALAPWDMQQLQQWMGQDRAATQALGDARIDNKGVEQKRRNANVAALGVEKDLRDKMERTWQAKGLRDTKELLVDLSPEDRKVQEAVVEAAARMMESGVNPQAIDGILQHAHPNVTQRVEVLRKLSEIKKAETQSVADGMATPLLLAELAKNATDPQTAAQFQAMAQIPGLQIWGAGTELVKLVGGREESNRFAQNESKRHGNAMTEITARNAGYAAGGAINWERTIIETALNRARFGIPQPGAPQGAGNRTVSIPEALKSVMDEFKTAGLPTAQFEGKLLGIDPQSLADYQHYRDTATGDRAQEITNLLRQNGRSPQQIQETMRLLSEMWQRDAHVRVGEPRMVK